MRSPASEATVANRRQWTAQNFLNTTITAHEKDVRLLRVYADLLRYQRLLHMAESGTDDEQEFVASRNMQKPPNLGDYDAATTAAEQATRALSKQIKSAIHSSRTYNKMVRDMALECAADPTNVRNEALRVAYSHLSATYMKYALALSQRAMPTNEPK